MKSAFRVLGFVLASTVFSTAALADSAEQGKPAPVAQAKPKAGSSVAKPKSVKKPAPPKTANANAKPATPKPAKPVKAKS